MFVIIVINISTNFNSVHQKNSEKEVIAEQKCSTNTLFMQCFLIWMLLGNNFQLILS